MSRLCCARTGHVYWGSPQGSVCNAMKICDEEESTIDWGWSEGIESEKFTHQRRLLLLLFFFWEGGGGLVHLSVFRLRDRKHDEIFLKTFTEHGFTWWVAASDVRAGHRHTVRSFRLRPWQMAWALHSIGRGNGRKPVSSTSSAFLLPGIVQVSYTPPKQQLLPSHVHQHGVPV